MRTIGTERFIVSYRIGASTYEEAKQIAWAIQVEQTIEFPYELLTDEDVRRDVVGRLESLERVDGVYTTYNPTLPIYEAKISYAVELTGFEATQFLNVLFGNSSLQPHIWVYDLWLPDSLVERFGGPRFGLQGIREICGVPKRAMIQAVVKPMGIPNEVLASMCHDYTLGGADVIKDDHGLTNQPFSLFEDRVARCAEAVREGNSKTNGHTLYAANVSGDGTDVIERAYKAKELGATALMIAPALVGFGWLHKLRSDSNLGLPIITHPAMMGGFVLPGVSGISSTLWCGYLPRLIGGDMCIFVSYGGRFTFSKEECKRICEGCVRPELIRSAIPSPGGGVTEKRLPELLDLYGNDTMFLVGGDMFRRGPRLRDNMKVFIDLVERYSTDRL